MFLDDGDDILYPLGNPGKLHGWQGHVRQSISTGMFHVVVNVGRADQGLAGHAAIVQAVSAEGRLLFDEQGLGTQLRRSRCYRKPGRPTADDADIVVVFCHCRLLQLPLRDQS